jgi:hypothetical protein
MATGKGPTTPGKKKGPKGDKQPGPKLPTGGKRRRKKGGKNKQGMQRP